jgi:hypothetical protein
MSFVQLSIDDVGQVDLGDAYDDGIVLDVVAPVDRAAIYLLPSPDADRETRSAME